MLLRTERTEQNRENTSPSTPVRVAVIGPDPITNETITAILGEHPTLIDVTGRPPDVALVADDCFLSATMRAVAEAALLSVPIVLLAADIEANALLTLASHGVVGILDRRTTGEVELIDALLRVANGESILPGPILGKLLGQLRTLQHDVLRPLGYSSIGLSAREIAILRMLAQGAETRDIARVLAYSQSTVKKAIAMITLRFNLRNRTEAVAFAIRAGVL